MDVMNTSVGAELEILAEQGRPDLDRAHGEHNLGVVGDTPERREAQNRAILDAIHQTKELGDHAA